MLLGTVRAVPGVGGWGAAVLIYLICTLASAQGDTLNEVLSRLEAIFFYLNEYLKLNVNKNQVIFLVSKY